MNRSSEAVDTLSLKVSKARLPLPLRVGHHSGALSNPAQCKVSLPVARVLKQGHPSIGSLPIQTILQFCETNYVF